MNRAQLARAAVGESLEAIEGAPAPRPQRGLSPEPTDIAYDLPGDVSIPWADLNPPCPQCGAPFCYCEDRDEP